MPLAGEILGQHHVAGADARHRAVAHLDLRLARERDVMEYCLRGAQCQERT
jgi:hypothetical protein